MGRTFRFAARQQAIVTTVTTQNRIVTGLGATHGFFNWAAGGAVTPNTLANHAYHIFGSSDNTLVQGLYSSRYGNGTNSGVELHDSARNICYGRKNAGNVNYASVAAASAFIPDGHTLNFTTNASAAATLLNEVHAAGADGSCRVYFASEADDSTNGDILDLNITGVHTGHWLGILDTSNDEFLTFNHQGYAGLGSRGMVAINNGVIELCGDTLGWRMQDGGTSKAYGYLSDHSLPILDPTQYEDVDPGQPIDGEHTLSIPAADTLRFVFGNVTEDGDPCEWKLTLFNTGDLATRVGIGTISAATGLQTLLPGRFKAQSAFAMYSPLEVLNTQSGNSGTAGAGGMGAVTRPKGGVGNGECSSANCAQVGVTNSFARSIASDKFISALTHAGGTDMIAAFSSFPDGGGVEVNVTTAPAGTRRVILGLLEQEDAGTLPQRRLALNRGASRVLGMKGVSIN